MDSYGFLWVSKGSNFGLQLRILTLESKFGFQLWIPFGIPLWFSVWILYWISSWILILESMCDCISDFNFESILEI